MTMSALRISELLTSGSQPVNTEKPVLIRDQTHSERIVSILWGRRLRRSGQISRDWTFLAVSQILSCGRPDVTPPVKGSALSSGECGEFAREFLAAGRNHDGYDRSLNRRTCERRGLPGRKTARIFGKTRAVNGPTVSRGIGQANS